MRGPLIQKVGTKGWRWFGHKYGAWLYVPRCPASFGPYRCARRQGHCEKHHDGHGLQWGPGRLVSHP